MSVATVTPQLLRSPLRYLLTIIAALFPAIAVHAYFAGNWYSIAHGYSLGMLFGIVAYAYLVATLCLSTRARTLDALFGHDRVIRFHAYYAAVALGFGILHAYFKGHYLQEETLVPLTGRVVLAVYLFIGAITLLYMTPGMFAGIPLRLRSALSRITGFSPDYSSVKFVHGMLGVVTALLVVHVLIASSTGESWWRTGIMAGLGAVALARGFYHLVLRPRVNRKRRCSIESIEQLNDTIVRLHLAAPPDKPFVCAPGQFAFIRLHSPVTGNEEHPFTFSSSGRNAPLSVTIKNLGNYTARIGNLAPGTAVTLDGPYGIFTPLPGGREKFFLAGGIGITPFLAILNSWRTNTSVSATTLVWSVKNSSDLIDLTFLESLHGECPWFTFIPTVSQTTNSSHRRGRITRELLLSLTTSGSTDADWYLCGPSPLLRTITSLLYDIGVKKKKIHFELFSF